MNTDANRTSEHCGRLAARTIPDAYGALPTEKIVRRTASLFGDSVKGVVLFGSFARGSDQPTSDIDILVLLDRSVPIVRDLYRAWDATPLSWKEHAVEPHFVYLPAPYDRVTALFAEVALDGVILFERGLDLSNHLIRVREMISNGRLIRRVVRGQSYLVESGSD